MESYKHIELTDEEVEVALRNTRKEKYFKIENATYHNKVIQEPVYQKLSVEELFNYAKERARAIVSDFVIDSEILDIFELLSLYFSEDKEFEQDGRSLKKGIMLLGPLGCGKTTTMKAFAVNCYNSFAVTSCRKVSDNYIKLGPETVYDYSELVPAFGPENFGQILIGRCFDDLGTETTKKHFGNELNVMAEIILNRYDNPALKNKTHFTANLTTDQIGEMYGERVKSRLREICNLIEFSPDSQDRRV